VIGAEPGYGSGMQSHDRTEGADPTGEALSVRRRIDLPSSDAAAEAVDELLELPGVASASLDISEQGTSIVVDLAPDVLSDDEIVAAIERAGITPAGWEDQQLPA
jgi:hypothetical protein